MPKVSQGSRHQGHPARHPALSSTLYAAFVYLLPAVLYFSYFPVFALGFNDTMNFELSLPLIWLVFFDAFTAIVLIKMRFWQKLPHRWWLWLLFPVFVTLSVGWSENPVRGLLTAGVLWLVYLAVFGIIKCYRLFKPVNFRRRFWQAFYGASLIACAWCVLQCILDLAGVQREATLLCAGCVSQAFGFPHPNGFAIEPQFMGNLLLAPALASAYQLISSTHSRRVLVLFFVLAATLFLTFSRGAIYAFLLALAFLVFYQKIRTKSWRALWLFPVTVLAFLFTLNFQGVMAQLSHTNDTYYTGISKILNHLSLGVVDFRPAPAAESAISDAPASAPATSVPAESGALGTLEPESAPESDNAPALFDGYVAESTNVRLALTGAAVEVWRQGFSNVMVGVGLGGAGQALYLAGLSASPKEIIQNEYASLLVETGLTGVFLFMLTIYLIIRLIAKTPAAPLLLPLTLAYGVTLFFFSGLPNALQIYLTPGLFLIAMRPTVGRQTPARLFRP